LILKDPKAAVFINNFTETSIHFSARVWTENAHNMQVKSDILEQCKDLVKI
jgi:small conductance mechanosensitive channel